MAALLEGWLQANRLRLETMEVSIQNIGSTELKLRFGHYTLEVMLPGCLVMVTEGMDERLQDMINDLNDLMSSKGGDPDVCVVLDHLLDTLKSFKAKRGGTVNKQVEVSAAEDDNEDASEDMIPGENDDEDDGMESEGGDNEDGDDYGFLSDEVSINKDPGSLYFLAAEAFARCASLKTSSSPVTNNVEVFFKYCKVADPARLSTEIKLEVNFASLLDESPVTRPVKEPLGLEGAVPTLITLEFDIQSWILYPFTKANFKPSQVQVEQVQQPQQEQHSQLRTAYGTRVLIPTLIDIFSSFCSSGKLPVSNTNHVMVQTLKEAADIPNPILGLVYFLTSQVGTLPAWCPLCCSLLPIRPYKLLSCQADKCMFEFQEQGLASCALAHVKKTPNVVTLELAFLLSAAAWDKRDVLEPFPSFLLKEREFRNRNGWFGQNQVQKEAQIQSSGLSRFFNFFKQNPVQAPVVPQEPEVQNKMVSLIKEVLINMPTVEKLSGCKSEAELQEFMSNNLSEKIKKGVVKPPETMEHSHRLSYKLLSYCLSSNRTSLRLLEGENKLQFGSLQDFELIQQFVVLQDTPEKEATTERMPEGQPSFFAFHGSRFGNWYSILRNGIRCMSKSKYMSTGNAYGNGIYCSHKLEYSLAYSRQPNDNKRKGPLSPLSDFACVAIVQVYHDVSLLGNYCYVIPKEYEERVLLRYLLLFPQGVVPDCIISGKKFKDELDLEAHHKSQRMLHFQ